jgi:acetoin utilization deacetylase AcuC-like enzyme
MSTMTLLYADPLFLKHDTGTHHPETAERLHAITAQLERSGLAQQCTRGKFAPLDAKAISDVHNPQVASAVRRLTEEGGGRLDADTVVSPDSYQVGLAAAGACVAAVNAVLSGVDRHALCLVRPPGHHATPTQSMGFCLFNNIALAARHATKQYQLSRILIVDFDVHHGNGTQDIFYEAPDVVFFSIHRYGMGFYPGTGAKDETGRGPGQGHIFNAPIRYGTSRHEYHAHFTNVLEKAADRARPELVLVSAGFDAHALDPIGNLGLEVEDFVALTEQILDVANTHASGRIVSCLEGGYNVDVLAECAQAHLEALL